MEEESAPIRGVTLSVFSHATEDENKVLKALSILIPDECRGGISVTHTEGHYSNPITVYQIKLAKRSYIESFIKLLEQKLQSKLSPMDIERRLDQKKCLYLRFDKQIAHIKKKLELTSASDAIQVKLDFDIPRNKILEALQLKNLV
ncbi:MAG: hypothetical protein HY929_03265 [Euryarchaeota archaeon]|nr:hypothetical protein [Euryarchaeota archaeon]